MLLSSVITVDLHIIISQVTAPALGAVVALVEVDIDDEEVYIQLRSSEHYEPERAAIANEGYQRIIDTIENLKPVWRDVVKMHFLEERSYTEISEALGITEDVCRSRISRARKYLEAELKDMLE